MEWFRVIIDVVLIAVVGFGTAQAVRLIRQLQGLHASRVEMERFVRDFNGAVIRAESGVKMLRTAARESGDDLEKLVERAQLVRDELQFIVESADSVAERLSVTASGVLHAEKGRAEQVTAKPAAVSKPAAVPPPSAAVSDAPPPASRAEQELMQALKKLSS